MAGIGDVEEILNTFLPNLLLKFVSFFDASVNYPEARIVMPSFLLTTGQC
jgi:hypothetical protein